MLNKRIVLGSLIAGAFLLPAVASAGVKGVCSNCHTMHNSQNGGTIVTTAQNYLLAAADCAGCHASAATNDTTGRGNDTIAAPQVDGTGTGYINLGGYFDTAAADSTHHNVADLSDNVDGNLTQAPGGTFAANVAGVPGLGCTDCHAGSGGHHGTSAEYRMLAGSNGTTTTSTNYGTKANAGVGYRSVASYNATDMNAFCGTCHGGFHTNANQASTTVAGAWVRHPTDISVAGNSNNAPSIVAVNWGSDTDEVPVGTDGTNNDVVMCLSCHVPHGGDYADLLAFNYNTVNAGDGTDGTGCEVCHSYSSNGM